MQGGIKYIALPAGHLPDNVNAIGQQLRLRRSILAAGEDIPFGLRGCAIAARGFQKYFKACPGFRRFRPCGAVRGELGT